MSDKKEPQRRHTSGSFFLNAALRSEDTFHTLSRPVFCAFGRQKLVHIGEL